GDIMFHMAQVKGAYNDSTGTYDFWPTYQYVAPYIQAADLAVVKFETTLHDTDYSGYPGFNSPVSSLQAIKNAGFDVLLYANNHCFDRGAEGLKNTLAHFREYGFQYVGATDDPDGHPDKTLIVEVNGIKIGMINYSDSVTDMIGSQYTLNDNPVSNKDWRKLNIYVTGRESEFLYDRVADDISHLRAQGADIIIAYMHWGLEYQLQPNSSQKKCAQKLCDLGVDCIIGGHPHVVQPMDVLTSSDGTRKMVCFYSLGNYVSNQNRKTLKSYDVREYTENGLMVKLIIRKYNNGYTEVARLEYVPTWVHRYLREGDKYSHEIIPLPVPESEYEAYGLTKSSFGIADSKESFQRTDNLFRDRIAAFNNGG
ncbi:MAG: CapA family protein, partial [Clostridia bacterium]|nr:CapA family protein [Clostridia bacterium]